MLRFVAVRLSQTVVVVFFVTLFTFLLVNLLPGNILYAILGDHYTKEAAAQLTQQLHLDEPLPIRYLQWLSGAVRGDFGMSLVDHQSVMTTILSVLPPTVELVLGAQLVATGLAIALAIGSVISRRQWIDAVGTGSALLASSIPSFVLALVVLSLVSVQWHLVSSIGWAPPSSAGWGRNLSSMALPCILLGLSVFPGHMRVFRSELHSELEGEEYVTLARLKGISSWRVIYRHVARNAGFGLITVTTFSTGVLVAGAVIIEQIFAIPGLGSLIFTGINNRDTPMVLGCVTVIAVVVVVLNLLADLAYAVLDPRVRDATT